MSQLPFAIRRWPSDLKLTAAIGFLMLCALAIVNQQLISEEAPRGIVSLELAAAPGRATAIILSWQAEGLFWARLSVYLDFVFIAAYLVFLLQLSRHWLADRPGVREQQVGHGAKVLFMSAAVADIGENICLLITLEQLQMNFWPTAAAILALIKFVSLLCGAGALVVLRVARGQPATL